MRPILTSQKNIHNITFSDTGNVGFTSRTHDHRNMLILVKVSAASEQTGEECATENRQDNKGIRRNN